MPAETSEWVAAPLVAHAPPTSALPQPPATVREKASWASTSGPWLAETCTCLVMLLLAPSASVTVSVTGYVPAVA